AGGGPPDERPALHQDAVVPGGGVDAADRAPLGAQRLLDVRAPGRGRVRHVARRAAPPAGPPWHRDPDLLHPDPPPAALLRGLPGPALPGLRGALPPGPLPAVGGDPDRGRDRLRLRHGARGARGGAVIPVFAPWLSENVRRYVLDCVDTGWISSLGEYV